MKNDPSLQRENSFLPENLNSQGNAFLNGLAKLGFD